jgi:hypothetical protein
VSERRTQVKRDKLLECSNEMEPFLTGELGFDPQHLPPISAAAIKGLLSADAIRQCCGLLNKKIEQLPSDDDRKAYLARAVVAMGDLLDALLKGQNHPLLDNWALKRIDPRGLRNAASRDTDQWRRECAIAVHAMSLTLEKPPLIECRKWVARTLNETRAYPDCKESTVKNWMGSIRPKDKSYARELASSHAFHLEPLKKEFKAVLKEWRPDLKGR